MGLFNILPVCLNAFTSIDSGEVANPVTDSLPATYFSMFEPLSPELIQVSLPNSPRRDPLLHGKIEAVNPNRQGA
jgi:hypothetical protein